MVGSGLLLITFGMLLFGTVVDINAEYWIMPVFVVLGLGMKVHRGPSTSWSWNRFPTTKPVWKRHQRLEPGNWRSVGNRGGRFAVE